MIVLRPRTRPRLAGAIASKVPNMSGLSADLRLDLAHTPLAYLSLDGSEGCPRRLLVKRSSKARHTRNPGRTERVYRTLGLNPGAPANVCSGMGIRILSGEAFRLHGGEQVTVGTDKHDRRQLGFTVRLIDHKHARELHRVVGAQAMVLPEQHRAVGHGRLDGDQPVFCGRVADKQVEGVVALLLADRPARRRDPIAAAISTRVISLIKMTCPAAGSVIPRIQPVPTSTR